MVLLDTQLLLLEAADLPHCLEVVVIIYHGTLMRDLPELLTVLCEFQG